MSEDDIHSYRAPKFACVYVGDSFLRATDTNVLCEIACTVPDEIKDKHILGLTETRARVLDEKKAMAASFSTGGNPMPLRSPELWKIISPKPIWSYTGTLEEIKFLISTYIHPYESVRYDIVWFGPKQYKRTMDPRLLERAFALFGAEEIITLSGAEEKTSVVVFETPSTKALVLPVVEPA